MNFEVRGVTASYGAENVLEDVSIVIPSGRVVALLGPNGAGKTTLLRTCSGLLPPRRGKLVLDGTDVTAATPHGLQNAGLCHVPEGRAVFPSLTVAENLRLLSGGAPDAVERAAAAFPVLARKLQQPAGTMSGGEQQMLALSRAYLTAPRYVLLDEVSMGLAPKVVDEIFDFLHQLAQSGAALLLVEQYVHKALDMADLVYVLGKGRIRFAGEASEVDPDALAASYLGGEATTSTTAQASATRSL
jgi:branched-chain amino acid transport system ATP-binding protein